MHLQPVQFNYLYPISQVVIMGKDWKVVREPLFENQKMGRGKKSKITKLSKRSLHNMLWAAKELKLKFKSMLTLTYGVINPKDGRDAKYHLNVVLQAIRDKLPKMAYFWFMEFTKKGRVHFHILLTYEPRESWRKIIAKAWSNATVRNVSRETLQDGWTDDLIEYEAEKVYKVHSHPEAWQKLKVKDGAIRYVAKYAMKQEQKEVPVEYSNCGRFWGRSRYYPKKDTVTIDATQEEIESRLQYLNHPSINFDVIPKYVFDIDRNSPERQKSNKET